MVTFVVSILGVVLAAIAALLPFFLLIAIGEFLLRRLSVGRLPGFLVLVLRSVRRHPLRTSLTYLATFVLVIVITAVWSTLEFLDGLLVAKSRDLKVIVTERWQAVSQLPWAYADPLCRGAADPSRPQDIVPDDSMTWQFYLGTVDPKKDDPKGQVVMIALDPDKMLSMMDQLMDDLTPERGRASNRFRAAQREQLNQLVEQMKRNPRCALLGSERLQALNKKVGERFRLTAINFKDVDLEFEVAGVLPGSRYADTAIMNCNYLNQALDAYPKSHAGQQHPRADRSLAIVWLQLRDPVSFGRVASQIHASPLFRSPAVKCETLSSAIATQLDLFRDLIWGMRWLLSPAIIVTITLVIATAISLSVRERRGEMAVLKVLGFRPVQIIALVLSEGVLVGATSGLLSCALSYAIVDHALLGSMELPFYVPLQALAWGPLLGAGTALVGSLWPACSATAVKVSDVFARVS